MKKINEDDLGLIYVHKIGYNSKDEGLYEFIFSEDVSNIDPVNWGWTEIPAQGNAFPPEEDFISAIYSIKTSSFDLFCLHEATEREYMHGYHCIHALAYEIERLNDENNGEDESLFEKDDDVPLLVFHYGMSLTQVKDLFYNRNIILKGNEFVEAANVKLI
jgi:hypothetical protein